MNAERTQILEMLAQRKITVAEAERLLAALDGPVSEAKRSPKFLCVKVASKDAAGPNNVNVRIPFQLLRSGVRLASLVPAAAHQPINRALHEQGIHVDISQLKPADLESLVDDLADFTVNVDSREESVNIYCE